MGPNKLFDGKTAWFSSSVSSARKTCWCKHVGRGEAGNPPDLDFTTEFGPF